MDVYGPVAPISIDHVSKIDLVYMFGVSEVLIVPVATASGPEF